MKVAYAFVQTPEELDSFSRKAAHRKTVDGLKHWADAHSNMLSTSSAATLKSDSKAGLPGTREDDSKRDEPTKTTKQSYADVSRQLSTSTKSPTHSNKSSNKAKDTDAKGAVKPEGASGPSLSKKTKESSLATSSTGTSHVRDAQDGSVGKAVQSKAAEAVSTAQVPPPNVGSTLKTKKFSRSQIPAHENLPKGIKSSTEASNSQKEKALDISPAKEAKVNTQTPDATKANTQASESAKVCTQAVVAKTSTQATEVKANTQSEVTLPAPVVSDAPVSHKKKTKTLAAKTSSSANDSIAAQALMTMATAGESSGAGHSTAKKLTDSPSSGTLLGDEDVPTSDPIPEPASGTSTTTKNDAAQTNSPTTESGIEEEAPKSGQAGPSNAPPSQNAPAAVDTSLTKKSKKSKSKKKAGQPSQEEVKPESSAADLASWIESGTPSPRSKQSKSKPEQSKSTSTPEQSKYKQEQPKSTSTPEQSKHKQQQAKSTPDQSKLKHEQLMSALEQLERKQEQPKSTPKQSKQKQASIGDLPSVPTTPVPATKMSQRGNESKITNLKEGQRMVVEMGLVEEKHRKDGNTFQDIDEIIAFRPHSPRKVNGYSRRDVATSNFESDKMPLPPAQMPSPTETPSSTQKPPPPAQSPSPSPPPLIDPSHAETIGELVSDYYSQKDASYTPLRNRAMDEDEKSDQKQDQEHTQEELSRSTRTT